MPALSAVIYVRSSVRTDFGWRSVRGSGVDGQHRVVYEIGLEALSSAREVEDLMKALVIDRSTTMSSVLHRILSMRGFEVDVAESNECAIDVLDRMDKADLILVDWILDDLDSLAFISRLRCHTANHPMIIMLAAVEPGIRKLRNALIAGADDYLIKPFTSLQIDEKLARAGFVCRI